MRGLSPSSLRIASHSGELLVILAGSMTLLALALSLGPLLFHRHIQDALGYVPEDVARHLDAAYNDARLVALAIAVGAAILTALAVSVLVSYRVVQPVRALAAAARRVAAGAYDTRVPAGGADEVGVLAAAFNDMAHALESAEQRRRELLSNVAHELRTPLAAIQGYVEGIADGVVQPTDSTWTGVRDQLRRLRRLADDLQAVSRAEERQLDLRLAATPPGELVAAAVRAAGPAFEAKGVALTTTIPAQLPSVAADRDRIAEVVANLLENALRHTPSGGHVVVSAAPDADRVTLIVADDGEGIAPEHLPRIFERFYRADPSRTSRDAGSGIGLTIARAIVEAHGGTIRAESGGVGLGTRLLISLPHDRLTHRH